MLSEEDAVPSLDDLFNDPEPAAKAVQNYACSGCGQKTSSPEPLKFCANCGASLSADQKPSGPHVLLAEDSAVSRRKITTILRSLGCRVSEATDGYEALRLIGQEKPDLVILDVHMPNKGGLDTLKELRQQYSPAELPVVMLTAEADVEVVRQAISAGAGDYIRKDAGTTDVRKRLDGQIQRLR
ncbi:MAG: response regulator [Gemmatimonadetes bacterium]|jgi:CheY-like chemotaxis protein|nr:response regulator [Gemmatimonadota bacterium]MBT6145350.1 response regulator [Gemmatimonadota bacterium]MBT7862271.1 response regulator [Gemmatimonadota bacterium]